MVRLQFILFVIGLKIRQCPANLSTLSLSNVSRDEQNNFKTKNLQNPFLVECLPLMGSGHDVSSCSSWCDVFASCNSKFLTSYRPFELEIVGGTEDFPSIRKLINVHPCGRPGKISFVVNITICNCTDGGKNFTTLGTERGKDSEIENPNSLRELGLHLPITSSDALPLSQCSCSRPVGSGPVI